MDMDRLPRMLLTSWCPSSRVIGRPRMSFGHTLKKFIIKLNDKLDDPNAKAWDPTLTGKAALKEHWRWTELAAKRGEWRKIIQRTDGGSGRRSRLRRMPQRVGRGGEQLREIVSRECHKRVMAATRRCHRLLQEIVAAVMPVTHALPLAT